MCVLGNEAISDEELQSVLATRPGQLLGFLSGAGVFNETEFGNDRRRIRSYYYDNGYVDVDVGEPQVELSRDLSAIYITIPIAEGEQYSVRSVAVSGDLLVPADQLMADFVQVQPGQIFSSSGVRQDMERISLFYKDHGYANVNVNLGTDRDAENQDLAITYDIQQGEPVYVRRITVSGNQTTRDEVIRREMRIDESDLYNATNIRTSEARISRLGFFETVEIREVTTNDPAQMDLEVAVIERPTGQFQVGAGFSSVESFIATATVSQNNLFGRGQSLSFQASLSALRTIFSLGFQEPYLFGTRWQFGFEIFNREILFTDFTRTSTGFNLTLGHPITDDIIVSGTYQLEDVDVEAGGRSGRRDRQLSNLFQGGLTSSIETSVLWDTRDNRLFPSNGFMQRASVEVADEYLGSENEFVRLTLISRWYLELIEAVVVKFNANLGIISTTDPNRPVPIFERYFLGGPNSVRGFERATLSPREPVAADPNDPASFRSVSGGW
jgi:outer membrane protein insertion porin family